jgi:hypothetical protein
MNSVSTTLLWRAIRVVAYPQRECRKSPLCSRTFLTQMIRVLSLGTWSSYVYIKRRLCFSKATLAQLLFAAQPSRELYGKYF